MSRVKEGAERGEEPTSQEEPQGLFTDRLGAFAQVALHAVQGVENLSHTAPHFVEVKKDDGTVDTSKITIVFGRTTVSSAPRLQFSLVEPSSHVHTGSGWLRSNEKVLDITYEAPGSVNLLLTGDTETDDMVREQLAQNDSGTLHKELAKRHKELAGSGVSITAVARGENDTVTTINMRIGYPPMRQSSVIGRRLEPFVQTVGKLKPLPVAK